MLQILNKKRPSENFSDGLKRNKRESEIETALFGCRVVGPFEQFQFAVADFGFPHSDQTHDLVFLLIGHVQPIEPLFAAAQAAFAVAFGVRFANADAGAGDVEEVGLFHRGAVICCLLFFMDYSGSRSMRKPFSHRLWS